MNIITRTVTEVEKGTRLDVWLATLPEVQTRNQAARLIEKNKIKVSGILPLKVKASYRLRGDETIEVEIPAPIQSTLKAQNIPIEILFQDNDIVVINKPSGIVTHPAAGHHEGTLVNALLFHIKDLSDIGGVERPGLVHRLDKETSGVLVVAKTNTAHKFLSEALKAREMRRVYWAIVAGVPKEKEKTIESFLARHPTHRKAFASQEEGKHAITSYEVVKTFKNQASLLKVRLKTGRTHQIRIHLSEIGHPVLGDQLYGVKRQKLLITDPQIKKVLAKTTRHALHAAELGFIHPRSKQDVFFTSDWPEDLIPLVEALQKLK
jgi:23S rRNA pseudouridine1911/1915/1917 synthase